MLQRKLVKHDNRKNNIQPFSTQKNDTKEYMSEERNEKNLQDSHLNLVNMIKNKKSRKNERWSLQLLRRIEYNIEGNKLEKIALEENKTLYNHIFK